MRRWLAGMLVLGTALMGCTQGETVQPQGALPPRGPFQGPVGSDVVELDVALLERPLGDSYINEELWQLADERVIRPEQKALMERNGLRVGLIGGVTPPGLLSLLTSRRSCVNPRGLRFRAGRPVPLPLGGELQVCRYQTGQGEDAAMVELEQALCQLVVVPTLGKDRQLRLQITPQIVHGELEHEYRPADDRSGWGIVPMRPTTDFEELSWEAPLGRNEYLVIGGRYDRAGSLGHQCFVRPEEGNGVQRLLVLRARPLQPDTEIRVAPSPGALLEQESTSKKTAPIALRAALSSARDTPP